MENFTILHNGSGPVALHSIPCTDYAPFHARVAGRLAAGCHCAHYFAIPGAGDTLIVFAVLLDDTAHTVLVSAASVDPETAVPSLTALYPAMHPFERDIAETTGLCYTDMPWDKPLRLAHDRADRTRTVDNYPFYSIEGEALHEVNVGPIHAGIIEPGAFRFICNGERVLHLEIALGYQHRGVEKLMTATGNRLRQAMLAEAIAGDSSVAHGRAFAAAIEQLGDAPACNASALERTIALEMERVAMHLADTGALCGDIGYQLGQVACEALRTVTINTTQRWCGNRFGKGLVRPTGTWYPLTPEIVELIRHNMTDVKRRYGEVSANLHATPSVLARFEDCGRLDPAQAASIGAVGMAARASGLARDLRASHPADAYAELGHTPVTEEAGDVMARLNIRCREVAQSIDHILALLHEASDGGTAPPAPDLERPLMPSALAVGLAEGWRGEVCHVALTDATGRIAHYKIKDPSLHNWLALALAVRGEGISDFPICNKSFNLSYCGHDL